MDSCYISYRKRGDIILLQYKIIEQPDQSYNRFVATHPAGHIFQSYQWGELKRYTGWRPWRIAIQQKGQIIAWISFLQHPSYGRNSLFYAPRGPVLDFTNLHLLQQLLGKVEEIAKEEKAILLKIDPALSQSQQEITSNLAQFGFKQVSKQPEETLQQSTVDRISLPAPNTQKYADEGLKVEVSNSQEMLKVFYAILLEYSQEMNLKIRSLGYFQQLWQVFQNNGVNIFLIRHKNYIIGGTIVIIFGKVCYSLYTALRQKYLTLSPQQLLHSTVMGWAWEQGCTVYEIINSAANKKTSINTRLYTYLGEFDLIYSPIKYKIWNLLVPLYQWSMS